MKWLKEAWLEGPQGGERAWQWPGSAQRLGVAKGKDWGMEP